MGKLKDIEVSGRICLENIGLLANILHNLPEETLIKSEFTACLIRQVGNKPPR